ncbi:MAG: hypothetical protein PHF99_06335 [Bacteroidales bacterium]|nr:hypothetical protein [Bacteroidales bacterium]
MFDNTDITIRKEQATGINFIEVIPQYLTEAQEPRYNDFGTYIIGYLDNLKISITENRVKVYNSSLCKYYFGNNFKTLNRTDTKQAIEKISDNLHLPINKGDVTRIDFSNNLIMQNDVNDYYKYLGQLQYYQRLEQPNGIYYTNGDKQVLFYGKVREQKAKRQPIPELYKNQNVLRYEMRYKKHIRQQLNRHEIKAELLYDEAFYRDMVKRWKDNYLKIDKINNKMNMIKPTGSTKQLIENLALLQALEFGQPHLLALVKEWQRAGIINKKQAQDHRNKIKSLSKIMADSPGMDLIQELNKKVKEAAKYC